jgi:hypothetical protein
MEDEKVLNLKTSIEPDNFTITFTGGDETSTVSMPSEDVHKVARLLNGYFQKNGIKSVLKRK